MKAFGSAIACYEVLANAAARLEREGPCLLDILDRAPGTRCLDLACGTGLHARYLAEQGATVDAWDLSPAMIAYAREHRAHGGVTYAVGDMRSPSGGPWDLALCLGNSLSLLQTESDLETTFARLRASLNPGGLFLFQMLNYLSAQSKEPRHRVETANSEQTSIIAVKSLVPRGEHTLLSLNYFVEYERDRTDSFSETATLRNWTRGEFERVAGRTGFALQDTRGSFDGSAFDPARSSDLIMLLTIS
jgi:2-polyprenyl-3-methyl-5-hydroxy-6-metoxy-1,4-benzoquinol methylase